MKKYNQKQVNSNLEKTFDIAPEWNNDVPGGPYDPTLHPVSRPVDLKSLENNQILHTTTTKKGRGGARPNSGRKVGSTVKLSAADLLKEISRIDKPFAEGLAEDYKRARDEGDLHVIQRYQQMFLSKVLADKQELDVTSNGHTLGASFTFPTIELPEWQHDTTKH